MRFNSDQNIVMATRCIQIYNSQLGPGAPDTKVELTLPAKKADCWSNDVTTNQLPDLVELTLPWCLEQPVLNQLIG